MSLCLVVSGHYKKAKAFVQISAFANAIPVVKDVVALVLVEAACGREAGGVRDFPPLPLRRPHLVMLNVEHSRSGGGRPR